MAIALSKPPVINDFSPEERQWRETAWRRMTGSVSVSADANAEIPSVSTYHGVTALSAGRALSLPPSKMMQDGDAILIQDESGAAGTHTITFIAQGTDTISGPPTITSNFGRRLVIKRGKGKYFSQ